MDDARVVVFFGLTGSGKSYLASRWAALKDYPYFNSDEVRKALAGESPSSRHQVPFNEGLYSVEMTRRTYREMLDRAAGSLTQGGAATVVLDAAFGAAEQQQAVIDRFAGRARLYFVLCSCSESIASKRFQLRARDENAVSDGRWEIYQKQKERFFFPDRFEGAQLCRIDTDDHIEALIEQVDRCVAGT
jgi:predicted kinase